MPPAIIDEVFIDFISEHHQIPFDSKVAKQLQLGGGKDFSRRIGGGADDHSAGSLTANLPDVFLAETPIGWLEAYKFRDKTSSKQRAQMITVKRLKDDDLIAGIEEGHARAVQRAGRSTAYNKFPVRVNGQTGETFELSSNRLSELRESSMYRVGVAAVIDRRLRG